MHLSKHIFLVSLLEVISNLTLLWVWQADKYTYQKNTKCFFNCVITQGHCILAIFIFILFVYNVPLHLLLILFCTCPFVFLLLSGYVKNYFELYLLQGWPVCKMVEIFWCIVYSFNIYSHLSHQLDGLSLHIIQHKSRSDAD